jgi:protein SCO1/2
MTQIRVLLAIILILLAVQLVLGLFWHPRSLRQDRELPDMPSPPTLQSSEPSLPTLDAIRLEASDGPFELASQHGKVVVLYFGYSYCPDVCPTSLLGLAGALKLLSEDELLRIQAVFVSVDPQRDTPKLLADYARFFHPALIGATGTPEQVAVASRYFGVRYSLPPVGAGNNYTIDHTSQTYLVGKDGRLARPLPHAATPKSIATAIRTLLAQPSPGVFQ